MPAKSKKKSSSSVVTTSQKLKPDQMAALASLWEPIGKSLLGGK